MTSPLDEIARASIDIPELARGVCGEVEVQGQESVHTAQRLFLQHGWRRKKDKEGWSRLEHRVYLRRGKERGDDRWLKITVGVFFGVFGIFDVSKKEPL